MALNYPGGFITKTPPAPTSTAAPGVWTLDQAMQNVKAGNWPPNGPYFIEDVFSTYLYTGTGSSQTITNGIDLSGKGGLVWTKARDLGDYNILIDTVRGVNNALASDLTNAQFTYANTVTAFSSTGFTAGTTYNGYNVATWTFREQPKFFDVVTFTTSSTTNTNQRISHNLGSTPGCIILKATNATTAWPVWHRSLASATDSYLTLNGTGGTSTYSNVWGSTGPTSTDFGINTNFFSTNVNYVAYIFAHNAGGFGLTGSDNVISCGSFATNGSGGATVTLNYEPQWILFKNTSAAENWVLVDTMRGMSVAGNTQFLKPNTSDAESSLGAGAVQPTATGFILPNSGIFASSNTYIYIAIRRGPMKTPTSGTSVFTPVAYSGNNNTRTLATGITTDLAITGDRNSGGAYAKFLATSRLQGNSYLVTSDTSAEATDATIYPVDTFTSAQTGVKIGTANPINSSSYTFINWSFRRAPGFFDVVCYTGTGANRTVNHNLGVAPELLITKGRTSVGSSLLWLVYSNSLGNNKYLRLNTTAGSLNDPSGVLWNLTTPTSSVFSLGTGATNESGANYVAYLFASVAGVSKVGSYTGTGTTLQVNCGFTNGSRFVLIKRTDTTGDWWVYDSARGIVAGNDPYLFLNTTDAEVTNTDYVDTFSSGFELSSTAPAGLNANGGTFIFLAIA